MTRRGRADLAAEIVGGDEDDDFVDNEDPVPSRGTAAVASLAKIDGGRASCADAGLVPPRSAENATTIPSGGGDDDCVPASLASFLAEAQERLEEATSSLLESAPGGEGKDRALPPTERGGGGDDDDGSPAEVPPLAEEEETSSGLLPPMREFQTRMSSQCSRISECTEDDDDVTEPDCGFAAEGTGSGARLPDAPAQRSPRGTGRDAKAGRTAAGVRVPGWAATRRSPPLPLADEEEKEEETSAGGLPPPMSEFQTRRSSQCSKISECTEPDGFAAEGMGSGGEDVGGGRSGAGRLLEAPDAEAASAALAARDAKAGGRAAADEARGADVSIPYEPSAPGRSPTPGAYRVQGRAPGARPGWTERLSRGVTRRFGRSSIGGGGINASIVSAGGRRRRRDPSLVAHAVTDAETVVYAQSVSAEQLRFRDEADAEEEEDYAGLLKKTKVRVMLGVAGLLLLGLVAVSVGLTATRGGRGRDDRHSDQEDGTSAVDGDRGGVGSNADDEEDGGVCDRLTDRLQSINDEVTMLSQCRCGLEVTRSFPENYDDVSKIISEHAMSTPQELQEECSHRNMALLWLAEVLTPEELSTARNATTVPDGTDAETEPVRRLVQKYVLALLYFAWNGDGWFKRVGDRQQSDEFDECRWDDDVTCNSRGEVNRIVLRGRGLDGTLPREVGHLTDLVVLELSGNDIGGTIPTELVGVDALRIVQLSGNDLSGTVPSEIANSTRLRALGLMNNRLAGTIHTEMGQLSYLKTLELTNNSLVGTLPAQFEGMAKLERLSVSGNGLNGTIPTEYGRLDDLEFLDVSGNSLTGTIPNELGNLSGLKFLDLRNNDFAVGGGLPEGFCDNLFYVRAVGVDCAGDPPVPEEGFDRPCCACDPDPREWYPF